MNKRKGSKDQRGRACDRRKSKLWMLAFYGDRTTAPCVHCGKGLTFETMQRDRIVPGGSYARDNIQPSCGTCNIRRGDSPITPFPV